jgi:hypothetical protein
MNTLKAEKNAIIWTCCFSVAWILAVVAAMLVYSVINSAHAFTPNAETDLECFEHYKEGETSVHEYSGRYYALFFTAVPGSVNVRQVNGYVYNPIGDYVPLTGTELLLGDMRVVSVTGLLRQHTQPWIRSPEPFYNIMRHIEVPTDGSVGQVYTTNDNKFYQPYLLDGTKVPRGNDGNAVFSFKHIDCEELPKVKWSR